VSFLTTQQRATAVGVQLRLCNLDYYPGTLPIEHQLSHVATYVRSRNVYFNYAYLIGAVLPHETLKTIFVARTLMIVAIWILIICFCITVYKLHFTPDWWKSKVLLGTLGVLEVFAGEWKYFNILTISEMDKSILETKPVN